MKKRPRHTDAPNGDPTDLPPHAHADETAAATATPVGPLPTTDAAASNDASDSGDSESRGADPVAEQEIAALAQEVANQKDKYLRLYADFENSRKRAARDRQEAESKGMGNLVKGILDSLDDLARFAHLDPSSTDTKTVVDGVELVERKLLKSLAGHGLEIVNPVGAPFDPAFHEALTTTPTANKNEDHTVAQVYQVGYVFNGMLLRAARVVVKQWQDAAGESN